MPQLPPVPGVTQAVLNYSVDGQVCRNVLHFNKPSIEGGINEDEFAPQLEDWWRTNLYPQLNQVATLTSIILRDLAADAAPAVERIVGTPNLNATGGIGFPNNVTVAMTLKTALRGRSYRGRIYHIGLRQSQVSGNKLTSAGASALITAYTSLINPAGTIFGLGVRLVVVSYWHNKTLRSSPAVTPVVAVQTDGVLDSQRRRLPGRGR